MERITNAHVYAVFIRLCNRLEKKCYISAMTLKAFCKNNKYFPQPEHIAEKYNEIGSWSLHNYLGRWSIQEMHNEGGGISHPLSNDAKTSREFVDALQFSLTLLYFCEKEKKEKGIQ